MLKVRKGYSFDDVLLMPKSGTNITSRKEVDLSVDLGKGVVLKLPFISANMKTITEDEMAVSIARLGGIGLIHRFAPHDRIIDMFEIAHLQVNRDEWVGASVGAAVSDRTLVDRLVDAGCQIISLDIAHGASQIGLSQLEWIAKKYPKVLLLSGSIATAAGAKSVAEAGADAARVGIGNGSICSTRIQTGCGVPQLTALSDVYEESRIRKDLGGGMDLTMKDRKFKIIADGGLRYAGDFVKALCFADVVMSGGMIAGTNETPGAITVIDGIPCKEYAGSSTHKTSSIEGIAGFTPTKGPVDVVLNNIFDGVKSGCSYQGAKDLEKLKESPEFIEISSAGLTESHPHHSMVRLNK